MTGNHSPGIRLNEWRAGSYGIMSSIRLIAKFRFQYNICRNFADMVSHSEYCCILVVNSLLVVYLLRLSEGVLKPLLTHFYHYPFSSVRRTII